MEIHDRIVLLIAVNWKILCELKAIPCIGYHQTFSTVSTLAHHVATLHTSYFYCVLQRHFIVLIATLYTVQAVYTIFISRIH